VCQFVCGDDGASAQVDAVTTATQLCAIALHACFTLIDMALLSGEFVS
jgi:hypothetical protein